MTDKSDSALAGSSRWGKSAAVLALGLGLVVTAAVWTSESRRAELEHRATLLERANKIAADIRQRLVAYELALRGGASLFAATDTPSREQWRAYVDALKLNESYPGIQAFAFAALLSPDSIALVERSMRANGFPNFHVWPGGPRNEVSAILYVEPLDASNARTLGYDMLADNARRQAMDIARESGGPALSGPVTLVQDAGRQSNHTAALMFVPVYRSVAPVGTPEERRGAMLGWVYAPIRPSDLIGSIDRGALLALRLYDDAGGEHRTLLHSDAATRFAPAARTDPPMNLSIEFAGRKWVLEARPTAAGLELFGSGRPWEYLAGGIVLSLLLFGIMWSMATTRARANALALAMTEALRRANQTLDRRVNERTRELMRINEKLRQEIAERELAERARSAALEHEARRSAQLRALADAGLGIGLLPDNQLRLEYLADRICRIVGCAHALVVPAGDVEASSLVLASLQALSAGERRTLLEAALRWPRIAEAQLLADPWARTDGDGTGVESSGPGPEVLGVPIGMSQGSALGTLYLVHSEAQHFADEDQAMVRQLTLLTAAANKAADLAEEERRARLEAETANSMKDQFLAIVSHELRTPLHAILGWLGVIDRRGETGERLAHALSVIRRNAEAQSMLIDDLLDLARIEQGKLQIDHEPVELGNVVAAVVESHRQAAADRGIRLECRVESGGRVLGDDLRLQQVLGNLIGNSLKFTPAGGQIAVRLHRDQQTLVLEVSDTGQGIPPKLLEDVFDRFRQADASSRRRHGGLGLGLALVRHIVQLHGGQVSAFSEGESTGATFTVQIPCIDPEHRSDDYLRRMRPATPANVVALPTGTAAKLAVSGRNLAVASRNPTPPGRNQEGAEVPAETDGFERPTVMLVDRSRDAQAMADLLDANDYTVVRFDSTAPALRWLDARPRSEWPLAVLCDLDPPDNECPEFVAALRSLEIRAAGAPATADSALPVIALGGQPNRQDDPTLRELIGQVPKPIRPQRLLRLLERLPR